MAKHKWQSDSMNSISIFLTHGIIFQQFDENQIGANLWLNSVWFFNAPTNEEPHSQTGVLSLSLSLSKGHICLSCTFSNPTLVAKSLAFFLVWYGAGSPAAHRQKIWESKSYIFMLVNVFGYCMDILKKRFFLWEPDYPGVFFPNLPEVFFQISLDYFYESSRVFLWISWSVF